VSLEGGELEVGKSEVKWGGGWWDRDWRLMRIWQLRHTCNCRQRKARKQTSVVPASKIEFAAESEDFSWSIFSDFLNPILK
jgi:hypothetical protein